MTEVIYLEVSEKTEAAKKAGRRVSVSGMLKFLGVSRSGYLAWLHHVPSDTEKRRKAVKAKIQDIYDDSKQNYGAPKITVELRKTGEVISERTVGTYMRQMGIHAKARRNIDQPLIIHSDRGSQYVAKEYKKTSTAYTLYLLRNCLLPLFCLYYSFQ